MKKFIVLLIAAVTAFTLAACGNESAQTSTSVSSDSVDSEETSSDTIQIVTTIFPEYDWICEILGDAADHAEVTMLLDSGVDLHSFQPTADDILKISNCDLFIYVGGESDAWAEDALAEAANKDMVVINLLDALGNLAKEEETVEGMETDEEENEEEETEYDEHVWLSLKNAEVLCDVIADAMTEIDTDYADVYTANAASYREKLEALDADYQTAVDNASVTTLLFGDRFPFRYLADDYGLSYYAAFSGCSAETEASFETIVFLAEKTDELNLDYILTLENSDHTIATTIIQNTQNGDQEILIMNSMQSITSENVEHGVTYLNIAEANLKVLKQALGTVEAE
ncbi:MAG: metal ABC transporter substrate-binding protein [Clostridiales bacterium]|nr:metal ABC transporter substrate-binding protein [Clostridiales bacterium]